MNILATSKLLKHTLRVWIPLVIILIPEIFPMYWMTSMAFKIPAEVNAYPPVMIPTHLTLEHLKYIFVDFPFVRYTINSIIVASSATVISLVIGIPAAYGIVRTRTQMWLGMIVLFGRMIPVIICLIPWFSFLSNLGLINTYTGLILTHLISGLPMVIWIMIGFFEDTSVELEEAALIDGCSRLGSFLRITIPLSISGIIVSFILTFIISWNDFIRAVIFTGPLTRTLPAAVFNMMTFEDIAWGPLAAASFLVVFPMIILTLVLQKHIVGGLTVGGVKE